MSKSRSKHLRKLIFFVSLLAVISCQKNVERVKVKAEAPAESNEVRLQKWNYDQEVNLPAGWNLEEAASIEMLEQLIPADYKGKLLVYNPETGNQPLNSNWEYDDLEVKIKFVLPESSSFKIKLYDDFEILLSGAAAGGVSGTLTGKDTTLVPYQREGRKALVWQTLEINAKAPNPDQPMQIEEIYLNGNLIHQQLDFSLKNTELQKWNLSFVPIKNAFVVGQVDFSTPELKHQQVSNQQISLSALDFQYFEGEWTKLPDFDLIQPIKRGKIDLFDINRIKSRNSNYGIRFYGDLKIAEPAEITFHLASDDGSRLFIGDSTVIDHDGTHGAEEKSGTIMLEAGTHPLQLIYFNGAGGAALRLFYQVGDNPKKPLNSVVQEKPRFALVPDYTLNPSGHTVLQRGFVCYPYFQGDASEYKFTHTISVGDPSGIHYNYDLGSGSLLQVWRGDFINTQTMWLNRGADQTAIPLGQVVNPAHPYNWQVLKGKDHAWADSISDPGNFVFKHYDLDESSKPVFVYQWKWTEITDRFTPAETGLVRKISLQNPSGNLWLNLARGKEIFEVGEGLYQVDEPGYLLKIKDLKGLNLVLREDGSRQELLVSAGWFDFDAMVEYEIIF